MTVLDLAGLTLMHLRLMVAEIVIFWIEVVVVCLYKFLYMVSDLVWL